MPHPIEFYFDYSSPYGYMASTKIEALAAKYDRVVLWRPFLLGVVFKSTGSKPLPFIPLKGEYARRDFIRSAAFHGVPFNMPSNFPIPSVPPARAFYWMEQKSPTQAADVAKALLRAYYVDDVNIADAEETVRVVEKLGVPADDVRAGINDQAVKDILKAEVDKAIARGVFGSPYIIVDGEPFWGMDRLDQVERWLEKGPW
jgi:2-hydroxychromene-2-carboxylate isomerase